MQVIDNAEALVAVTDAWRAAGLRIGIVPTMGYLHRGHASLMSAIRGEVDRLIVSIYVNPLQFGANEDLDRYPRDLPGDLARCEAEGVDVVFTPNQLYPPGFATRVRVDGLTAGLCGAARPTHFEGVTTVVARLLGLARADVAIFGEKDWQQLVVLRQMVHDLAMPVRVVPGPIVRDDDGLAMSSRNAYLSPEDRRRGLSLSRALRAMQAAVEGGQRDVATLVAEATAMLEVDRLDYVEIVDALRLTPLTVVDRPARALVAAMVGKTRLIDNMPLGPAWTWS
jgi:pantoate--beta-alanine ligase